MQLQNDLILQTLRGEQTPRKPVWLMRQAGRILPEYRAIRNSLSSFIELVTQPELAAEVTIQPVDILQVDAAIIFSDILVVPEAMGVPYLMEERKGPIFPDPIKTEADIQKIRVARPEEDLFYVLEAIRISKKKLAQRVPLIGFAGAPWTIFAYMVEGQGSKTFSQAKRMLYQRPDLAHRLLNKITQSTIAYLKAQIQAGADLVQVFDSWAGLLSPTQYEEFSLRYIREISEAVQEVPLIIFAKGAHFALESLSKLNVQAIGLDWTLNPVQVRKQVGDEKVLQGNLDPCLLYAPDEVLVEETQKMLEAFGAKHIANLGHGVYPDTDPEKVKLFIQTVKNFAGR
ncbi:MAG: uroporphyrinogen decarboxylase [Microscillaceae bacterium]|nr:uroporphyrinogen decarboxylase [Microscillaceae bacterium]